MNPRTKKIEINLEKNLGKDIVGFELFGERENKIICITSEGYVILYCIDYAKKRGVAAYYELEMRENILENLLSIAVCEKHKYAFVGIADLRTGMNTRMVMFKVRGDKLFKRTCIDQNRFGLTWRWALECLGYAGSHILWISLSKNRDGRVLVYDYDTETEELKELDMRVGHQEDEPTKLHLVDGEFYYTGKKGQLMKLSFCG